VQKCGALWDNLWQMWC